MTHLTQMDSWNALKSHSTQLQSHSILDIKQSLRTSKASFNYSACKLDIDFTNQKIIPETLGLLIELAEERELSKKVHALFNGVCVNFTENRPALHTALRQMDNKPLVINGKDIMTEIFAARAQMDEIAEKIRNGNWLGYTGKPITDIVNIGIGGSDLGPRLCISALDCWRHPDLNFHFVTSVDPYDFNYTVKSLDPETTLFLISSKSFTTRETLQNAKKAVSWLGLNALNERHFIAITANGEAARRMGFKTVLPIWDWVGGRYSLCSAINLITMIAIGYENFSQILLGAHHMDQHYLQSELSQNIPALLGLIGVWNNNFLATHNFLMLTYAQQLEHFVPYIQQLDMESNGKSTDSKGEFVNYATGPMVWGGLGNQAQHSYFQLLCQGTHQIAGDCIGVKSYNEETINHFLYEKLRILSDGIPNNQHLNKMINGNIPLNLITLDEVSPYTLGALISLYEHKIYTQSVIWDINPFDQPGVESAKQTFSRNKELAKEISIL
ncbi:glucose-6-phosphate isomerase [Legionella quinlivanii]|uniref:Glucose-6-phosphate isomerase n=1 Tax=Legionella quinlivanii TaxID=45073 RepID=A0A0W0Y453_9GAMM|nr:glucose-6-phosphate isomerase [Legionella quinlivanii]KTD51809.1 glucose-6-phosphate isomerase [Legionella quinlivanii]MCW8451146.1 glucose-6-phosphate isomerase [Legionella quinlivanii]SEF67046.1 glucose-6-phosphate isomerase [Legionella quinlivanii DSM 21216]STY10664.1 glucose-6-phosphate isomerase [Legionella quinlivanii]